MIIDNQGELPLPSNDPPMYTQAPKIAATINGINLIGWPSSSVVSDDGTNVVLAHLRTTGECPVVFHSKHNQAALGHSIGEHGKVVA